MWYLTNPRKIGSKTTNSALNSVSSIPPIESTHAARTCFHRKIRANVGKIDPEQLQRFIRGSIASTHTLELTARDLEAVHEATTARAKRASLGRQFAQKGGL